MLSQDRSSSFDVEFNHVAMAVAQMLARKMDDVFLELVQDGPTVPHDSTHRTAEVANRVVVLCRRLTDELRRYERYDQIRREVEEETIPF